MTLTDYIYLGFRVFDSLGTLAVAWLWWRKTKRLIRQGKLKEPDGIQIRLAAQAYFLGTSLLYMRGVVVGAPGGFHLALITIPILMALKPLIHAELDHQRAKRV